MATQQKQPGLRQRSVVSSFLFTFPNDAVPLVALFRRSDKVNTYRRHLAPISGSIDAHESPVAAAWRELNEETTLTSRDVDLWRQGKPYSFSDASVGRQWTIFPFAFRLKSSDEGGRGEAGIHIDWEHEGWEWHKPGAVVDDEQFGGVPRLAESLRRVWFEGEMDEAASTALSTGLNRLKTDHQSGSHELTSIALQAFRDVLVQMKGEIDSKWWETTRMTAWHLCKNGRESMGAATTNAFLGVLADMQDILDQKMDLRAKRDQLLAVVDRHLGDREAMSSGIKNSYAAFLKSNFLPTAQAQSNPTLTLLTLSGSSTIRDSVLEAFTALTIAQLDLRILESRPLYEGVSMASSILSQFQSKFPSSSGRQLKLTIYTDASAAIASSDVDFVLLGADRISEAGSVSNKTGSLPAVLCARHVSPLSKVLVLSELEKVAEPDGEDSQSPEENDPQEVMGPWVDGGVKGVKVLEQGVSASDGVNFSVDAKNIYFEWVAAGLIDAYICEEGALDAAAIGARAQRVKQKADRYFGSL